MSAVIHTVLRTPACLMKRNRSAISSSRPSGGAVALRRRVVVDEPDRQVGGDHLPGRARSGKLALEPGELRGPEERASPRSPAAAVRPAIAAHVEHEHVEQRPVGDLAIDAAALGGELARRRELVERAAAARRERRDVGIADAQRHAGPPVVGDLVVVPLREHRDLGVEGAQIMVEQVVFVVAAEVGERLGDARLFFRHDVAPDLAVRELLLRSERAFGIDVVAAVDEEIRPVAPHRRIGAHAAARRIDPPAAAGVARPDERDRPARARRAEAADLRLAADAATARSSNATR